MTRLAEVNVIELKRCPRCEESLPISEFGVCRARKDGLNLYCKGCIRQKIAQVTKLPKDEVCDALANLLLWTHEIRTQVIGHNRMYFVNDAAEESAKSDAAQTRRKRGLNPSFSSVGVLMPGRKPSARGKKRSVKAQSGGKAKEKSA